MAVAATKKSGNGKPSPKHNIEAVRQAYYDRIAKHDMRPLWKVMDCLATKEPVSRCQPAVWHFDDFKSLVMESGSLITAEEATRRKEEAAAAPVAAPAGAAESDAPSPSGAASKVPAHLLERSKAAYGC